MRNALRPSIPKTSTIICVSALLVAAAPLRAEPATTTWTAYLYQGPGAHYSVVDEIPQAARIDVGACNGEWCKITSENRTGYLRAEVIARTDAAHPPAGVLAQPAAALGAAPPPGPCVTANQTGGNGGNAMTVFCLDQQSR